MRWTRRANTLLFPGSPSPVLFVSLSIDGQRHRHPALVDSGANRTLVPAEFLPPGLYETLSIELKGSKGAGGRFEVREGHGVLSWHSFRLYSFAVAEPGKLPGPVILLGLRDFFAHVSVEFHWDRDEKVFTLERRSRGAGRT